MNGPKKAGRSRGCAVWTVICAQILRMAFHCSFFAFKRALSYEECWVQSEQPPRHIGKIVIGILIVSVLIDVIGPVHGFLALLLSYVTYVVFNFLIGWLLLDTSRQASLCIAKRYIEYCLVCRITPQIPFILYLRPFAVDSSLRLHLFDPMDWIDAGGNITGHAYHEGYPLLTSSNYIDYVHRVQKLTNKMGVWIQSGNAKPGGIYRIAIELPESEWEEQISRLCEAAQFMVFLPLFGVNLETNIKFIEPPTPEIAALLKKNDHDGLGIEMRLLSQPTLLSKTIFMLPPLSMDETKAVYDVLGSHGILVPKEVPYISENNIRLYRCRTQWEAVDAVEIGPYTKPGYNEGLGLNEFSPVTDSERWTKLSGNAIEYLLEDDAIEREQRWPHGSSFPRIRQPRRRVADGGPYALN